MTTRTPQFDHVLVTRFNIPSPSFVAKVWLDEPWLEKRLVLFERYCAASVAAQHDQAFVWAILVHPHTPGTVRTRLAQAATAVDAVLLDTPTGHIVASIREAIRRCGRAAPFVITSRLDSDDALHVSYIERLHAAFAGQELQGFDFPWGYTFDPRVPLLHQCRQPSNPFVSLVERASECPHTVYETKHLLVGDLAPLETVDDSPAWMQVIHGDNVLNKMNGRPIDVDVATCLRTGFGVVLP